MLGFGIQNTDVNSHGWSDLDLQNAGGSAIAGHYRWEVYRDSSKEDLIAVSGTFSTTKLRNAVSNSLRDKILLPALFSKVAGNDSYLVLSCKARPSSDGDVVDVANSSSEAGMAYGELKH